MRREGLPAAVARRSARMRSAAAASPRPRRKRKAAHSAVPSLSQSSQVSAGAPVHQLCGLRPLQRAVAEEDQAPAQVAARHPARFRAGSVRVRQVPVREEAPVLVAEDLVVEVLHLPGGLPPLAAREVDGHVLPRQDLHRLPAVGDEVEGIKALAAVGPLVARGVVAALDQEPGRAAAQHEAVLRKRKGQLLRDIGRVEVQAGHLRADAVVPVAALFAVEGDASAVAQRELGPLPRRAPGAQRRLELAPDRSLVHEFDGRAAGRRALERKVRVEQKGDLPRFRPLDARLDKKVVGKEFHADGHAPCLHLRSSFCKKRSTCAWRPCGRRG